MYHRMIRWWYTALRFIPTPTTLITRRDTTPRGWPSPSASDWPWARGGAVAGAADGATTTSTSTITTILSATQIAAVIVRHNCRLAVAVTEATWGEEIAGTSVAATALRPFLPAAIGETWAEDRETATGNTIHNI